MTASPWRRGEPACVVDVANSGDATVLPARTGHGPGPHAPAQRAGRPDRSRPRTTPAVTLFLCQGAYMVFTRASAKGNGFWGGRPHAGNMCQRVPCITLCILAFCTSLEAMRSYLTHDCVVI